MEAEAVGVYFTWLGEPTSDELDPAWRVRPWVRRSLLE